MTDTEPPPLWWVAQLDPDSPPGKAAYLGAVIVPACCGGHAIDAAVDLGLPMPRRGLGELARVPDIVRDDIPSRFVGVLIDREGARLMDDAIRTLCERAGLVVHVSVRTRAAAKAQGGPAPTMH